MSNLRTKNYIVKLLASLFCVVMLVCALAPQGVSAETPWYYNFLPGAKTLSNAYSVGEQIGQTVSAIPQTLGELIETGISLIGYYLLLKPASLLLWIAGIAFNVTLNFTLNFGTVINDPALGLGSNTGAIYIGWSTIRNFINVAFIFVLLYTSIAIILRIDKSTAQAIITKVVMAALLLNFSLFFTKAIIDFSNIIALQFYSRIIEGAHRASGFTDPSKIPELDKLDNGISTGYLNALGISGIWGGEKNPKNIKGPTELGFSAYELIIISLFGSAFMVIFAFTLLMAAVQFMIRSVLLILLMITSPVGFLAGAVPGLESASKDWWAQLKKAATFAPVYMALLYMVSSVIFGANNGTLTGNGGFLGLLKDNNSSAIGTLLWFFLVIGLLIAAQIIASKFSSSFGSSYVKKADEYLRAKGKLVGQKYWGGVKGVVTVPAGRIARRTDFGSRISGLSSRVAGRVGLSDTAVKLDKDRLDKAKEDAKNLRRGRKEDDESYKKRQNEITNRAQIIAWKRQGLTKEHFDIDPATNKASLNDKGRIVVETLRTNTQKKYTQSRRKAAQARIETIFGPKENKKGGLADAEAKLEELNKKKAEISDETKNARYHNALKRYKKDVEDAEVARDSAIRADAPDISTENRNLANAQKALAAHTREYKKIEEDIEKQKYAIEEIKRREEEKKKKDEDSKKK